MSNYGSTRTTRIAEGTRVVCVYYKQLPERISKRTGEKKPAEMRTHIVDGVVLSDNGHSIYVDCQMTPGDGKRRGRREKRTFFPHEVTVEADLFTHRNGLGG